MQHLTGSHSLANLDPFQPDWTKDERDYYEFLAGRPNDTGNLWPLSSVWGLLAPSPKAVRHWESWLDV